MGDSHYWTSLWVFGLVIIVCIISLQLVLSIIVFFSDRIITFEIWNSPIWLKLKIPVIILCFIGVLAAAIVSSRHKEQREMKVAQDYAQAQGWGFSRDAADSFKAEVEKILSGFTFNPYNIRTVETGWRNLYLFDCSYNSRESSGRKHPDYGTACLVLSNRFRDAVVPVEIFMRDWTEVMESDKVDMGESPFAQKFVVQSKDSRLAKRIVTESIKEILLKQMSKPDSILPLVIIGPGGVVLLTGRTAEPGQLAGLLELARKLDSTGK